MIKLHARVTKEIEITEEQAERLNNYLDGTLENNYIEDILEMFTNGVDPGNYENGYIPGPWLTADLQREYSAIDIDL